MKNNILFGKEYDVQLFRRVIHAAALEAVRSLISIELLKNEISRKDLVQLSNGVNTFVGDHGVMLSGVS